MRDSAEILNQIQDMVSDLRVYVQNDGGDLAFESFENGILKLKILGNCKDCPFVGNTFNDGVKQAFIDNIPEVNDVIFETT